MVVVATIPSVVVLLDITLYSISMFISISLIQFTWQEEGPDKL